MHRFLSLALVAGFAPASAQPTLPRPIQIELSSFRFEPSVITLQHGQPYVLHFVNRSSRSHDFSARTFFDAASIAPADRSRLTQGKLELKGGDVTDVHIVAPAPGRYNARCSHFLHSAMGMKAFIVVD